MADPGDPVIVATSVAIEGTGSSVEFVATETRDDGTVLEIRVAKPLALVVLLLADVLDRERTYAAQAVPVPQLEELAAMANQLLSDALVTGNNARLVNSGTGAVDEMVQNLLGPLR